MAYLSKEERYEEILNLAMEITEKEGLSAITARKIAAKGKIAVGQIHHHFASISQLKALALKRVSDKLISQSEACPQEMGVLERLINIICPMDGEIGNVMRKLWSEAQFLAEQDEAIRSAYKQSVDEWYQTILNLIEEGIAANIFHVENVKETTWILIAASCGFDSIAVIEDFRFEKTILRRYIYDILQVDTDHQLPKC